MENATIPLVLYVCLFLFVVSALFHYTKNSIVPFVTWLLVLGWGYGYLQGEQILALPELRVDAGVIFYVLLPLLIFESAQKIKFKKFKKVAVEAGIFATVGVFATAFILAFPLAALFHIPILDMLLFGSIIAATDPIAVLTIFERFQMPEKLKLIIEGESLLNDGTALVFYSILVSLVIGNNVFMLQESVLQFSWAFGGAFFWGSAMGLLTDGLLRYWEEEGNSFIATTITVVMALITFLLGEHYWHVSGVIAVMVAAMVFSNSHYSHHHLGWETRSDVFFHEFWKFLAALANSILFFLLGVEMFRHLPQVEWLMIPAAIVLLLLARSIVIYGGSGMFRLFGEKIPLSWQHILNMGGLKGALSIALLFLLPADYKYRELFLCLAFVMILFTLLVNTIVMHFLLKKTDLAKD